MTPTQKTEGLLRAAGAHGDWLIAGLCQILLTDTATGWAALAVAAEYGGELWADVEDVGPMVVGLVDAGHYCEAAPQRVWLAVHPETYAVADDIIGGLL
jgi:hypothetical protein